MGKAVEAIGDIISAPIEFAVDILIAKPLQIMGDIIGGEVGEFLTAAGDFANNVVEGIFDNITNFAVGVVEGDFKKAFSALGNLITTALVVVAVVYSGFTLLPILAGIIVLDAQYNSSALLLSTLQILGTIEHAIFGTDYIHEYKEIIAQALVLVSTFYISYVAFGYISEMSWVIELKSSYATLFQAWKVLGDVMAGYQIYDAFSTIINSAEYWRDQLLAYTEKMQNYIDAIAKARMQWIETYSDPETIGRVLAGGDIYNAGPGSALYSISDAYEPYRYQTGIVSLHANEEMDKMANHDRYYYGMAGSDAYMENLIKGKIA